MSYGYAYDGPPTKCSAGPRPGTKALRDGVMTLFPGIVDLGIHNCRPTRNKGSKTLSFHADGRAWDPGCRDDLNETVFQFAIAFADELGIQEAISKRRRWDSRTREIAHYGGDDPHTEHVHLAQCLRAANSLTLATVLALRPRPDMEDDEMEHQLLSHLIKADNSPKVYLVSPTYRVWTHVPNDATLALLRFLDSHHQRFLSSQTVQIWKASDVAALQALKG